jgi:uncharacterized protein (TIGR00290 family)
MRPKAIVSWSSGKDSAFALHLARAAGVFDIVALLTTLTEDYGRVSMHGVREELLDLQAEALGLPCFKVKIPAPCPPEVYASAMQAAMDKWRRDGVTHVIFGDLFLEGIREYRERQLQRVGMHAHFPLWGKDTHTLARDMIAQGLEATLSCIDPRALHESFAGRKFDAALLDALPETVDPCGENGEFHTLVTAGPMFERKIDVRLGPVVEREGFVFADLTPA